MLHSPNSTASIDFMQISLFRCWIFICRLQKLIERDNRNGKNNNILMFLCRHTNLYFMVIENHKSCNNIDYALSLLSIQTIGNENENVFSVLLHLLIRFLSYELIFPFLFFIDNG